MGIRLVITDEIWEKIAAALEKLKKIKLVTQEM
jgi:hypothetical protein